jgi:proteic killer suppression protein
MLIKKNRIFAVEITFANSKLKNLANNYKKCQKELGKIRANKYNQRLGELRSASTLEDVRHLPGHYHELTGNRKGQWACDLDQPYRLIFEPHEKPIPTDSNDKYIWSEIKSIKIIEIVNYH